jgi:hypothetical protein
MAILYPTNSLFNNIRPRPAEFCRIGNRTHGAQVHVLSIDKPSLMRGPVELTGQWKRRLSRSHSSGAFAFLFKNNQRFLSPCDILHKPRSLCGRQIFARCELRFTSFSFHLIWPRVIFLRFSISLGTRMATLISSFIPVPRYQRTCPALP